LVFILYLLSLIKSIAVSVFLKPSFNCFLPWKIDNMFTT
jgi:hypothetical protein